MLRLAFRVCSISIYGECGSSPVSSHVNSQTEMSLQDSAQYNKLKSVILNKIASLMKFVPTKA